MRISDWSSDVCSSDLADDAANYGGIGAGEIIAGAVVLGGLAAILSSSDNDRYDRSDARYRREDRKSVGSGKRVSVRVDLGGRRIIKKNKAITEVKHQ